MMRFVLSVLLLLCSAGIVGAGLDIIEVGKHGDVYPVVEPDPAEEISRAAEAKLKELEKARQAINPFRFAMSAPYKLPPCENNSTLILDPSYTLPEDVLLYDAGGKPWHYPAGTTINPLDYVPFGPYAVIDPSDKKQLEWLAGRKKLKVLVVSLEANDTAFAEQYPVLVYSKDLHDLLGLACVPALMTARDGKIEIKFFGMQKDEENIK